MKLLRLIPIVLLFGLVAPVTALPDGDEPGVITPVLMCRGSSTQVVISSTPVCNCTGAPANVEICHTTTVEVQVGSSVLQVSTGSSAGTCVSQTKNHGECLYFRYVFDCCHSFWSGWTCTMRETQAMSSTSTCGV